MATIKRKKKYLKKQPAVKPADTFEIEERPPVLIRGNVAERAKLFKRIDDTLLSVQVGQAFIIPTKNRNTIQRYLHTQYPAEKFAFTAIFDNPDHIRVYRLEYVPTTSYKKRKASK